MENTPGAMLAGVFSFLSRGIRPQKHHNTQPLITDN